MHYAPKFIIDNEVVDEMYEYLNRMSQDMEKCSNSDHQLKSFKEKDGKFVDKLVMLYSRQKHQYNAYLEL